MNSGVFLLLLGNRKVASRQRQSGSNASAKWHFINMPTIVSAFADYSQRICRLKSAHLPTKVSTSTSTIFAVDEPSTNG